MASDEAEDEALKFYTVDRAEAIAMVIGFENAVIGAGTFELYLAVRCNNRDIRRMNNQRCVARKCVAHVVERAFRKKYEYEKSRGSPEKSSKRAANSGSG